MSAEVIDFALARARKRDHSYSAATLASIASACEYDDRPTGKERFQFWTGASGERYVHTVYDLITCPTLPAANYMLIKRDEAGDAIVLAIGRVDDRASSLNLAKVRRHGAELGASEVHVHLLADDPHHAHHIQHDLQAGYLAADWPAEKTAWAH